jgi:hypothetical protein
VKLQQNDLQSTAPFPYTALDGDMLAGKKLIDHRNDWFATPPPGRMPSSTAARVACIASSTRSLRSLTSTSVAPPTRDHRDAACELGQPLLQLLAVVVCTENSIRIVAMPSSPTTKVMA